MIESVGMIITEEVRLCPGNPYMLRNDGELLTCDDVHPYIRYSHVSPDAALENTILHPRSLKWFYEHTADPELRNNIEIVVNSVPQLDSSDYEITDQTYRAKDRDEVIEFLEEVQVMSNQEFLRLRMSSPLYGGTSKSLYARISSLHFDWYPLLWSLVHANDVSDITVIKDSNTFGGRFEPYKVKGQSIYEMPKDEFLTLSGNPVLEMKFKYDVNTHASQLLYEGKSYRDAYYGLRPRYARGFFDSELSKGLEFDLNNILVSRRKPKWTVQECKECYDYLKPRRRATPDEVNYSVGHLPKITIHGNEYYDVTGESDRIIETCQDLYDENYVMLQGIDTGTYYIDRSKINNTLS